MLVLFNSAEIEGKVEVTQDNFQESSHINIKGVFNNADTLSNYKWFIDYVIEEIKEKTASSSLLQDEICIVTLELLTKMSEGDVNAINGDYMEGRICLRQFIHKLINAENPNATSGNPDYDYLVVDYSQNPEKVSEFLQLYKINRYM